MEKRNFVTSFRTSGVSDLSEDLVATASDAFRVRPQNVSELEKKASAEDEKSDTL